MYYEVPRCMQCAIYRPLITPLCESFNMANEILTSFLGALQASLSVLLVIFYGVLAAQFNILKGDSTKQISTLCVRLFLPALLITKVGSQLHSDTGIRYVPILSRCLPPPTGYLKVDMLIRSAQYGDSSTPSAQCFSDGS